MRFDGFYANESLKNRLSPLIENKHFPHAIILEGENGSGRKTLARIICGALLCSDESEKPCYNCNSCKKVFSDSHPDVNIVFPASATKQITVDVVREVKREVFILPNESSYKISVFANAGALNEQAQNALLKVIEEPPTHGVFILICNSRHELLQTIQSRCAVFSLSGVEKDLALKAVKEKVEDKDDEQILQAIDVWGGIIGKVIDGFNTGKFDEVKTISQEIASALIATNEFDLMLKLAPLEKDKQLIKETLTILKLIFRDAIVILSNSNVLISGSPLQARQLSERLTQHQLINLIDVVEKTDKAVLSNINISLVITTLCYKLREAIGR